MSGDQEPLRVVFDCNIFIQAALYPNGPAAKCLERIKQGAARLYWSDSIIAELRRVLDRPRMRHKFPRITPQWVEGLLIRLNPHAELVTPAPLTFEFLRDPKDVPYLQVASTVNAHFLVSRDHDFLVLRDGTTPDGQAFRHQFPDLIIVDPVEFLSFLDQDQQRFDNQEPNDETN